MAAEYLYRYNAEPQFHDDHEGGATFHSVRVRPTAYRIEKRTPCGAWIPDPRKPYTWRNGRFQAPCRFVNLKARKKFAAETREEALEQFKFRSIRRIGILRAQLKIAESGLERARSNYVDTDVRFIY